MKYGARNQLSGKITQVKRGDVMSSVKIEIPAQSIMCSVMTTESLEELGVAEGDSVTVIAKAINVLLAKAD